MKVLAAFALSLSLATPALAADAIGEVRDLSGDARATGPGGDRTLDDGDDIFLGDEIATEDDAQLEIEFNDDTEFQIGGGSRLTIDEFVYSGGANDQFGASLLAGTMRFVSGAVAGRSADAMRVSTPIATIGVRGTTAAVKLEGVGGQFALLESEKGGATAIMVSNTAGSVVVDQPNFATTVAGPGVAPTPPEPLSRNAIDNLLSGVRAATTGVVIPRVFGR